MKIDFAHQTFRWSNDASGQAAVHVVIIGFSRGTQKGKRKLWEYPNINAAPMLREVESINAYLTEGPSVLITSRKTPLSTETPKMDFGSMPNDGGFLSDIDEVDVASIRSSDPIAAKYLRKLIGGQELIHSKERYCLWLPDASPADLNKSQILKQRVAQVKALRSASKRPATQKLAQTPALFGEMRQPKTVYLAVPLITSENRDYLTVAVTQPDVIANNKIGIISLGTLAEFAVLSSRVFTVWNKTVSGRLKSDLNVSITITYNNFPFPDFSDANKQRLESLSTNVLAARSSHPKSSLADLYGATSMPLVLRKAHEQLDAFVLSLYGLTASSSDSDILGCLFSRYEEATSKS